MNNYQIPEDIIDTCRTWYYYPYDKSEMFRVTRKEDDIDLAKLLDELHHVINVHLDKDGVHYDYYNERLWHAYNWVSQTLYRENFEAEVSDVIKYAYDEGYSLEEIISLVTEQYNEIDK